MRRILEAFAAPKPRCWFLTRFWKGQGVKGTVNFWLLLFVLDDIQVQKARRQPAINARRRPPRLQSGLESSSRAIPFADLKLLLNNVH